MAYGLQPQPYAAIELIHKQPVRWTHDRVVACDGGGGPTGHPRIFINTDKPEINVCNYCGLPFVRGNSASRGRQVDSWLTCDPGERAPQETPRIASRDLVSFVMRAAWTWVIQRESVAD